MHGTTRSSGTRAARRRTTVLTAVLAAGLLLALAACGGGPTPSTAPAASTTSAGEPPTTATTTDQATDDAGMDTPSAQTTSPTEAPTTPTATAPTATASGGSLPTTGATRWPRALGEPGQGDPVWAVYLALAHSGDDPAIDAAVRKASRAGYTAVQGDLACDQGAIEALGLDQYDYWSAATLYFASRGDAADFVASYQAQVAKVAGSAQVNLGCLD